MLQTGAGTVVIGRLARAATTFSAAVSAQRNAQAQLLATVHGRSGFADGLGDAARPRSPGSTRCSERCCSAERLDGAKKSSRPAGGEPRLGLVQLLDPDADSVQATSPLPENWATFLLVPAGARRARDPGRPSAATYVFDGDIEAVNRDLQQLHFRRAPLALTGTRREDTPDNPTASRCGGSSR